MAMNDLLHRVDVVGHDRSICVGACTLFPIDQNHVAMIRDKLEKCIRDIENRCYAAGVNDTQVTIRRALGIQ